MWFLAVALVSAVPVPAAILWSDLGTTHVYQTGEGSDILGGAVKRDAASADTLFFKLHVNPVSDAATEQYFAGFELYEAGEERLAVGNSLEAWAYSAFNAAETGASNRITGDVDLHSSRPQFSGLGSFFPYELPRQGIESTIVFKAQYEPGTNALITVWLNPDLGPGATEAGQSERLVTRFRANARFDEIRLRHGGGGGGWNFSDMAIATSFNDFVSAGLAESGETGENTGRGSLLLTFQSWQREQGLPQNSVRALTQTRDGYLWMGSDDGVARFDGVRFVPFGMREGLWGGPVNALFEDVRGALWIGTEGGGLIRLQAGQFTTFTAANGLPSDRVISLAEDNSGRLWVGTDGGLVIWSDGHSTETNVTVVFRGKPVTALFKDSGGAMWLGATGAGVFQYRDGRFAAVGEASLESLLLDPHCVMVDRAGRLWVGAGDDYVLCREGSEWHRYRIPRHLARPYVTGLAEQANGTVWAGSVSEGLFRFRDGKPVAITASSGLSDNFVRSLLVDQEGNLWVGTAAGLNRLRHSNLSVFRQDEGLGYGAVSGMVEVAPGIVWAGKPTDGIYRWAGRNFASLDLSDQPRAYREVNSLLLASEGGCWVATAYGLLRFQNPATARVEAEPAGLEGLNVSALAEDRRGVLWAGTRDGEIWRQENGDWRRQTNYSQSHPITALVHDREGWVWIATDGGGLHRYRGAAATHFEKGDRLLSRWVKTLHLDAQGVIWIGTAGGGLSCWRDGQLAAFTTREGLPDNTISQILEDDRGRLWLGSNRGIACVRKRDLEELAAGHLSRVHPQVYGRAEGMLSEECTSGFYPAGLKTRSGLLWFSTLKGIVVADPSPRSAEVRVPSVVLEEVLVDGIPTLDFWTLSSLARNRSETPAAGQPDALRIPPGRHRIEFKYTGLSFNAPDRVRFRYQMEGLDAGWLDGGTERAVVYSYVPPGKYRFRVLACNSDGVWNEAGASLALTVLPHFWQAWWFIGLAALGTLAAVGGAARLVEKRSAQRRMKMLEQERALARERARIAQDLHDDLGSSLARISLLSGLVKADKQHSGDVESHMDKIAQSADESVRALEEIVWAVRPGSDSLQSLVEYIAHFGNEFFAAANTRCRLDLPHDLPARALPPEMRHNIFLIVKEALANVLRHGSAREVLVQAQVTGKRLEILVQDDGRGFDLPAALARGQRNGLGNMHSRAESMGASLELQSAPGKGTTVRLIVDLPEAQG